ncbi:MAG: hypothetical protein GW939_04345 [Candidatus Magasanikbacteria bacterium]|uniref:Replication-associated protein ORF2/G2P domain-containing protein n=1 Tax=Candidatus Magasanikbacteria bacterium CG10_big_fil_rev_8_21_14_0_10_38_6 TaxID=1974647 RepID=A0A2M6P2M6_9BACT|nr:hypothetical protein [Candidatus Magasanikbacteria bacterium]PIR77680.1 MAG: hypothetical protein COU30_01125 [Candidatus Magasanikbacteria bacterium CG10_big_fil_rev_8_21_14_0_10_38_6]
MAYPYTLKVVVSGKQVEVYKYTKEVWRDFESKPQSDKPHKEPKQLNMFEQEELRKKKVQYSINRTKTEIRRLVNSNPHLNKFMTLTFADNVTDLKTANYLFNQFVKRISYRYKDFEYFAVPEFQKRGAVHYHVLCNLPYVEMGALEYTWGHGIVNIRKVDEVNNLGAYMSKYLGKELFSGRMFGKKKFFRSQTLKEPVELISWWAMKFIDKFLSLLKPVFEKKFESEYIGEVEYTAYTLDRVVFKDGILNPAVLMGTVW